MSDAFEVPNDAGATSYGLAAVVTVRMECGVIVTHEGYAPGELTPEELAVERLVRLDRDSVGVDALRAELPAERKLVTIQVDGSVPAAGALIYRDGEEAGRVTSPTSSPLFGTIAMSLLTRSAATPATRLEVEIDGRLTPASVYDTHPGYDPEKRRPRG
jgi:glycine cleavage system aminomethyltransferase T